MLLIGSNDNKQLIESSSKYYNKLIDKPVKFHVDPSSLLSFSTYFHQLIWITQKGKAYANGNNVYGHICGTLPKECIVGSEIIIENSLGQPYKFVSVYCGYSFTLFLALDESDSTLRLVYCFNEKKPNPLFLNIGKRIPQALFGGRNTSGCIDTEGGIIIITADIFDSPKKKIEASFLPNADRAVKLCCCDSFVIALGISGRVYECQIAGSAPYKFEEINVFSTQKVVDVAGSDKFCLIVLENGKVFGRGSNNYCSLGFPQNQYVSDFTEIKSLENYKIVSAFTGIDQSIFKTIEGKMIVCGWNKYYQLFDGKRESVFPPKIIESCNGFNFCVLGSQSTAVILGSETPQNMANKKIESKTSKKIESKKSKIDVSFKQDEVAILKNELEKKDKEIKNLKDEISNLKKRMATTKDDDDNQEQSKEIKRLKDEISNLKRRMATTKDDNSQREQNKEIKILDEESILNLERIEEIGYGGGGKVIKVYMKNLYALKEMNIKKSSIKSFQQFIGEYEIMNLLHHPNILKTFGIFLSSKKTPPSILLEYCPQNLEEIIMNKALSNDKIAIIIYQIVEGMKYIHFKKIIHRDLKPTNILIAADGTVKICDFGISKLMTVEEQSLTRGVGTQKFMAPEIINEEEIYNEKVDVYSFGVVVFFILSGGDLPKIKVFDILKGKKAEIPADFTDFSKELIYSCWNIEPNERPSFDSILKLFEKNHFNLIKMTEKEMSNVDSFVKQHKLKIPKYD